MGNILAKFFVGKPEVKRQLERRSHKWNDNVLIDLA
jgi:hypothetical protein